MKKSILIFVCFCVIIICCYQIYQRDVLPKKTYVKLVESNLKNLYGWEISPRYDKLRTSYQIDHFVLDNEKMNSNSLKFNFTSLVSFYSIDDTIDLQRYSKEIEELSQVMKLDHSEVIDSIYSILHTMHLLKINSIGSDKQNRGIVSFDFGNNNKIVFLYVPNGVYINDRKEYLKSFKQMDSNWYYLYR